MSRCLPCSLVSLGGEEPRLDSVVAGVGGCAAHGCPSVVGGTNLLFGAVSTHEQRPDDMAQGLARRPHAERSRRRAPNGRGRGRSLYPCARAAGRYASVETALKGRSAGVAMKQRADVSRTGDNTREPAGRAISRRAAAHFKSALPDLVDASNKEQTAHLQTALLRHAWRGPRYEPLSRGSIRKTASLWRARRRHNRAALLPV